MNGDANRDPAKTGGEPAPAGGMRKPRLAALGFLAAFALSTLTLIYTGLLVRAPESGEPEQGERAAAPVERTAPPASAGRDAAPEPAEREPVERPPEAEGAVVPPEPVAVHGAHAAAESERGERAPESGVEADADRR